MLTDAFNDSSAFVPRIDSENSSRVWAIGP
jgi:hypothetical protein